MSVAADATLTAGTPDRSPSPASAPRRRRGTQVPWPFALPALTLFAVFFLLPTVVGAWYAFTDWDGFNAAEWVGTENFREMADQPRATEALKHSVILAGFYIVGVNVLGLLLALGLNTTLKTEKLLRALFFFPAVVSPLAIAYVWRYILDADGAFNEILDKVGLDSLAQPWLGQGGTALGSVWVVMLWQYTGWHMLIYLAGLQSVQRELHEAAAIDGAGAFRRFNDITRPLLLPAFIVSLALSTIMAFTIFDQIMGLTGGGPIGATETIGTYIYKLAFLEGRFGYSAAVALVLTVGVCILAAVEMTVLRRRARWRYDDD